MSPKKRPPQTTPEPVAPSQPSATEDRRWLWLLAGISVIAFAIRLAYLLELRSSLFFAVVTGDGKAYDAWAQRIAAGDWIGSEVFYQTPLYPYLLATLFKLFGHSLFAVRIVQALAGAASCFLLGFAGQRFFGPRVGIAAASLLACYAPAIFFDGLIQKASLDALLLTGTLALLGEISRRRMLPPPPPVLCLGLVLALFTLNRENARVLVPIVFAWLILGWPTESIRRRAALAAVFVCGLGLVLMPVALRNYRVGGEFLISTSQLGPNFYIGNHAGASGGYDDLIPGRGTVAYEREDATRLAEEATGRKLRPSEVSSYWLRQGVAYIAGHPIDWLRLFGKKLLLTVSNEEIADTESLQAYSEHSTVLRGLGWLRFGLLLPLCVLGVWLTRKRWRPLFMLYAVLVAMPVAVALFFVLARYRYAVVPIVALFAAVGAVAAFEKLRGLAAGSVATDSVVSGSRNWLVGSAFAAIAAAVAFLPTGTRFIDQTNLNIGAELVALGRSKEAIPLLEAAAAAEPFFAPARYNLGLAAYNLGQRDRAAIEFEEALRAEPNYLEANNALGIMMLETKQPKRAVELFQNAVRLKSDSAQLYRSLGDAFTAVGGRMPDSIDAYERSLKLAPDSLNTLYKVAVAYAEIGRTSAAVDALNRALEIVKRSGSTAEEAKIKKAIDSLRAKPR